jgi:hypothetical protein
LTAGTDLSRRPRAYRGALGAALARHGGIAVSMGLVTFSVVILAAVAVLVGHAAWMAVVAALARLLCAPSDEGPARGAVHRWPGQTMAPAPVGNVR